MGKKLAIRGHLTRGKEVIKLLEMMGGKNNYDSLADNLALCYLIDDEFDICAQYFGYDDYEDGELIIFTLEDFLEKYPFKIGNKVIDEADGCSGVVSEMKWDEEVSDMKYYVAFKNGDVGWFANDSIEFCKETDTVKPVTNKSERTHEEDYFREVVKKNNENKMSDCKKCGLGFGSVRCFSIDCPHNAPKSYAVGLKDGKVIECGVNKEIVMNDKNHKMGPKSKLPSKYYEEKQTKRDIDKSEFIIKHMILPNKMDDKLEYEIIDGYEFEKVENNKIILKPIKPKYPTTYDDCCDILNADEFVEYELMANFPKLINARNTYWKIAGEEMGLDKPWEPDWGGFSEDSYPTITKCNGRIVKTSIYTHDCPLAFPTEEMRDAFYENFKDLIEQCKELL